MLLITNVLAADEGNGEGSEVILPVSVYIAVWRYVTLFVYCMFDVKLVYVCELMFLSDRFRLCNGLSWVS